MIIAGAIIVASVIVGSLILLERAITTHTGRQLAEAKKHMDPVKHGVFGSNYVEFSDE